MTERIGRNIFSLGLSRIISGVILFFVYVRLVTYLGPGEFGKFSLVLAYFTIFSLLVDLGISRYVIKKVSEDKNTAGMYLSNFFLAQLIISAGIFLFFLFVPRAVGYEMDVRHSMYIAGFGLFVMSTSIPFASIIQAWQKIHLVAAVNFINTLINALWLAVAIYFQKDLLFIFWIYAIIGGVDLGLYWIFARKSVAKWDFQRSVIGKMIIYGIPFAFISGFEILISKIDVVIQKFYLPYAQVGLYSGAYRFLDFLTFIPAVVAVALFPHFSEKTSLDEPEIHKTIDTYNRYMILLALPLGVGAAVLAERIILSLFDARYLGSVAPFQVLIWATVLTLVYAVPNAMMIVKRTRLTVAILAVVTLFNVLANVIFVPRFGIMASAWITVVSYFLVAIWYITAARKLSYFGIARFFGWPALGAAVMGVGAWLLRDQNLVISVSAAIILYFAFLLITGFLKRSDWEFIKSAIK